MTNEERDLITRYIGRIAGAQQGGGGFAGGSVPQSQPALPPIDRDADALIAQLFQQYPEARYRITQTALVQEAAFAEAQNQIRRLQWELEQTRHAVQNQPQQSPQQKGFLSSLFGGGGAQQPQQPGYGQAFQPTSAPPQPQYPPSYQPGMFQRGGGSGFLGSALTTAAGVAGGMFVGNALMGAFSGSHNEGGGGGLFGGGGLADSSSSGASPWDGAGVSPAADTSGGFLPDQGGGGFDQASSDPFGGAGGGFDTASNDPFGGGGDAGGGFDGGGGGFDQA